MALQYVGGVHTAIASVSLASDTAHSLVARVLTATSAPADWLYLDVNGGAGQGRCWLGDAGSDAYVMQEQDDGFTDQYLWSDTLPAGWHHYALTFDGTTWTTYLDGAQVDSSSAGTIAGRSAWNFADIGYGSDFTIQDVALFTRALSGPEVLLLSQYRDTPAMNSGLYFWLPMFSGTELVDESGNGHDLASGATPAADDPDTPLSPPSGGSVFQPTWPPRRFALQQGRRVVRR